MSDVVALECSCGSVKGELSIVPKSSFHVHCLCCDCQNFAAYLNNKEEILDEHGGSELFQTYPAYMKISEGQDKLAGIQLTPKGIYRWHTTCCNMPVGNTMTSSKMPFVGISVKLMNFSSEEEKLKTLGPVVMKAFGKYAIGEMPKDAHEKFPISFMPKIMGFMAKGMFKKKNAPSPFFNGKEPVAEIKALS